MPRISVITGDLIDSTRVADSAAFRQQLDTLLAVVDTRFNAIITTYRGDGFQIALHETVNPFHVALLLRTGLIAHSRDGTNRWDARVAIAYGEGALSGQDQNGPAYVHSGRTLDAMGKDHLQAKADHEVVALALGISCRFADAIVNDLTAVEAEILYYYLLEPSSHQRIADKLGKQRPTITLALQRAHYKLLDQFISDMDRIMRINHE
ncbi:MAG: hypothetical protein ACE37N_05425 [Pseudohongiellaceae bacterium]|jgi:hypothetical protein